MKFLFIALITCTTISAQAQISDSLRRDTTIYNEKSIAVKPQFPGGEEKLNSFLVHTIRYPAYAREHNVQGKVVIAFVVEKDGSLTNFKVVTPVSDDLAKETIRVFKLSPKWVPGKISRSPVRALHLQPCSYNLQ